MILEMLTTQERVCVVLEYHSLQSVVSFQRKWRHDFSTTPPSDKPILFKETGREIVWEKVIGQFENQRSSSMRCVLREMDMRPFSLHVLQELSEEDFCARKAMCDGFLKLRNEDDEFLCFDPMKLNFIEWSDLTNIIASFGVIRIQTTSPQFLEHLVK